MVVFNLEFAMGFYSPFTGPFSPYPIPGNVLLTEPVSDNTIDIGTSTKRYKTLYATDVKTTSLSTATITAGTSISTPDIELDGDDLGTTLSSLQTEIEAKVEGVGVSVVGNVPRFADTTSTQIEDTGRNSAYLVSTNSLSSGDNNVVIWGDITGTVVKDPGIPSGLLVLGADPPTTAFGNIATFKSPTSTTYEIEDSGVPHTFLCRGLFSLNPPDPVNVTNTTTPTSVLGPGTGSLTVNGSTFIPGTKIRVRALTRGDVATTGALTFSLQFTNGASEVNSINSTWTNDTLGPLGGNWWSHEIEFSITADLNIYGSWQLYSTSGTLVTNEMFGEGGFVDDGDNTFDFLVTWNTATTGNSASCKNFSLERLF